MAAKATYSPKDVARELAKSGRKLDAKRVRAWVRDHVARFDDDGYTSHDYSTAEYRTILAGMRGQAKTGRTQAAVKGRAGKPSTARKPAPGRAMGSGPVSRVKPATVAPAAPDGTVAS